MSDHATEKKSEGDTTGAKGERSNDAIDRALREQNPPIQEEPVCAVCGHPIGQDDLVCPNCGVSLVAG